ELQVRVFPKLHGLLQRVGGPSDRGAVAGAGPGHASQAVGAHPSHPRGRGRSAHAGLAQGVLRAVSLREEPRAPQRALQLRAHAGGLARQVAESTPSPWTSASSTPRSTRSAISPTPRTWATRTAGSPTAR